MCEAELELFVNRDSVESCCLLQRLKVSVGTHSGASFEVVRAESVAHFSHRVRHLHLNRKNYGVPMSGTRWLGVAGRHSNKGSAKPGVGGAGDGFFVGAEFRTVLVRFLVCRSFSLPVY